MRYKAKYPELLVVPSPVKTLYIVVAEGVEFFMESDFIDFYYEPIPSTENPDQLEFDYTSEGPA